MTTTTRRPWILRWPALTMLTGVLVAGTYEILSTFKIAGFGAEADIGGGAILLLGLLLIFTGATAAVAARPRPHPDVDVAGLAATTTRHRLIRPTAKIRPSSPSTTTSSARSTSWPGAGWSRRSGWSSRCPGPRWSRPETGVTGVTCATRSAENTRAGARQVWTMGAATR